MSKIDWTKPIRQTDGRAARFFGELNVSYKQRFAVAITVADGEVLIQFDDDGYDRSATWIIENIPEPEGRNTAKPRKPAKRRAKR